MSKEISEKDKPFVLAIVSSGITVLNIILAGIGAYTSNKEMISVSIEMLKFTFPLTTMAWTFYFGKKT